MPVNIAGCGACTTKRGFGSQGNCLMGRPIAFGFQRLTDSAGDVNFLDTTSATLGADLLSYVDMSVVDPYKRIFMTPKANKLTFARSDENFANDDNNTPYGLGTGEIVTVTAEFWDQSPYFAEDVRSWTCSDSQVYMPTIDGQFTGTEKDGDHEKMYGQRIVAGSLTSRFYKRSPEMPQMVKVTFVLEPIDEKNSVDVFLDQEQLGYNPTTTLTPARHLDAVMTPSLSTTLQVVLRAFSTASNKYNYGRDLTVANGATWTVYNLTDGTTITPSSVTFTDVADDLITAGNEPEYTVTITAQTTGDDLRVGVIVPKYLVQLSNTADAL
tara:strand:+ start:34 stop:1011 length:978 start_codon:yes stop_codon:yes gene_type:complete